MVDVQDQFFRDIRSQYLDFLDDDVSYLLMFVQFSTVRPHYVLFVRIPYLLGRCLVSGQPLVTIGFI